MAVQVNLRSEIGRFGLTVRVGGKNLPPDASRRIPTRQSVGGSWSVYRKWYKNPTLKELQDDLDFSKVAKHDVVRFENK